jgi:signal transduction histidine kinase
MRRWIALAAGIAAMVLLATNLLDTLELPARDLAVRLLPSRPATSTVVIAIDERSLREHRPWPWPRADLAAIIDRCAAAGAKAVILDMLLAEPRPDDAVLAQSMKRVPTAAVSVLIENEEWLLPAPRIREATVVAHGNFELDHDGILRRFASTKQNGTTAYTALSLEAASVLRNVAAPIGETIAPAFRTPPRAVPRISATDVLHGRNLDSLRGKVVFVGPTALGLGDRVLTPVSASLAPDAGVTVHAAATESLVRGEEIRSLAPIGGGIAVALAVLAILETRKRWIVLALAIAVILAGELLLSSTGIAIPFVTLLLAIVLSGVAVEATRMTASLRASRGDVERLQEIATRLAEQQAQELESKRLLAHELKTPIASMRSLTQLLAGFSLSDAERHRVAVLLESEAGKLERMVGVLLDLERLRLRAFPSELAPIDLGALTRARVDVLRASTTRALETSIEPGGTVRADALLMERVIDNLVTNAVKYTQSTVTITVRCNEFAMLEVEDHGPGIPAADQSRIFDRFVRGATARGTEGLGLGLAFVREVAEWHDGDVSVETVKGGGSRFVVRLPRVKNGEG